MDDQKKISTDFLSKSKLHQIEKYPLKDNFPLFPIFYEFEPQEFAVPERLFQNPLKKTELTILRGKVLYNRFCVPCHNVDGKGNGPIVTQVTLKEDEEGFPSPKDLTSENTRNKSDGRLFHILSAGQNLMFSFNDKLSETDKWCIVHYIRILQNDK
ncbi:MAG: cytochrome c [Ignavibacteria bacterium]|nr:cytochrome c [Ignavibacteria bacterium]